jgi:hypothetical protein
MQPLLSASATSACALNVSSATTMASPQPTCVRSNLRLPVSLIADEDGGGKPRPDDDEQD